MRIVSMMLLVSLSYTFVHETVCHEESTDTASALFSHPGPEHDHDGHVDDNHDHPDDSEHDSDHHDDDSHEHQFRVLITKKDPSTRLQVIVNHAGIVAGFVSGDCQSVNVLNRHHYISQLYKPPSPEYLRDHVLLL